MQQQISFLDLLSGKTSPEPLAATREKTSKPSSNRFVASGGGQDHIVPMPPKNKWATAGVVDLDGGQLAWRVMDAQHYGVPQRRRRVFLVSDLGGHRAGEILFEREGVCWNFAEIRRSWQDTSRSLEERIGEASRIVMG